MKKRNSIALSTIAAHLTRIKTRKVGGGEPVKRQSVAAMLKNLDKGRNRERLTAALIACHLTPEGVKKFFEQYQSQEK